ncbi:MAG: LacI family DNA-binding transcriptional regulator [Candidatus Bipolaricaulaceae bacterium]
MATLEDVARRAGVSWSTVSRVINGHPYVSLETRGRVLQAIRDVGYQPNSIARSLVTRKTRIIGIVIPEAISKIFSDQFFAIFLHGAAQAANVRGYQLILSLFDDPDREESLYASAFESGFIEGAIIASAPPEDSLIRRLCASSIPTVAVGKQPSLPYVDVDNRGGAFLATEHLIKLGYQRIATITGPLGHLHVQDRLEGYRTALEKQGVNFEEDLVVEGGSPRLGRSLRCKNFCHLNRRPSSSRATPWLRARSVP